MSNNKLYIPKKIKAGFQNRSDTFNGKLSYIIYYDDKGVLRKEKSWEGWRAKDIPFEDYGNEPTSGFLLHKDVKRYNWDHFSSNRTLIRVFDPRGMEFEITTDNLLFILQHTDCVKRELVGKFVYAWYGPELILLPEETEEYRMSSEFTKLQGQKFSAKNLVAGRSYKTKQTEDLVYVGRHMWYDLNTYKEGSNRLGKKYHIFTEDDGKSFILKSSAEFIANENSEHIVQNYAEIVDNFNKNIHSSKIVKFELIPTQVSFETGPCKYKWYPDNLVKSVYFKKSGDVIAQYTLNLDYTEKYDTPTRTHTENGYTYRIGQILTESSQSYVVEESKRYGYETIYKINGSSDYWNRTSARSVGFTKEDILSMEFCDLYVTLENGKRVQLNSFNDL